MRSLRFLSVVFLTSSAFVSTASLGPRALPKGIDVSGFQPNVNWATAKANGVSFAYIKATEGTTFKSSAFSSQYRGAFKQGIIRGAYHFAHPGSSSGAAQADFFVKNGGAWSGDGLTLPGALDIEYNPNGAECYGLSASVMVSWIRDFVKTYHAKTTRYPVIYTTTDWWTTCTGNSAVFAANSPLWVARYANSVGRLPAGWNFYTFWQFADSGTNPGDADRFNGDAAGLKRLAKG